MLEFYGLSNDKLHELYYVVYCFKMKIYLFSIALKENIPRRKKKRKWTGQSTWADMNMYDEDGSCVKVMLKFQ